MELFEAIKNRRSIRKYTDKKVPDNVLKRIIDAARWAPSATNKQDWRYIIVTDNKIKEEIVKNGAPSFIKNAPVGILVLYSNLTDRLEYRDDIQSASASIQNMLLAAYSVNLGCCWTCNIPPKKKLRKIFRIPWNYDPIAYISVGYYEEKPRPKVREKEFEEVISYNRFDFNEKIPSRLQLKLRLRRLFKKIYYTLPMKRHIDKLAKKYEQKFD